MEKTYSHSDFPIDHREEPERESIMSEIIARQASELDREDIISIFDFNEQIGRLGPSVDLWYSHTLEMLSACEYEPGNSMYEKSLFLSLKNRESREVDLSILELFMKGKIRLVNRATRDVGLYTIIHDEESNTLSYRGYVGKHVCKLNMVNMMKVSLLECIYMITSIPEYKECSIEYKLESHYLWICLKKMMEKYSKYLLPELVTGLPEGLVMRVENKGVQLAGEELLKEKDFRVYRSSQVEEKDSLPGCIKAHPDRVTSYYPN